MTLDTSPRGRETVTAFFDTRGEAEAALERLRQSGLPVEDARIYEGRPMGETGDEDHGDTHRKGFWETLGELFLPSDDRDTYAEGLTRGGTLLSVPVRRQDRSRVVDILDDEGTIDLDERRETWRDAGWGGPASSPAFGDPGLALGETGEAGDTGLTAPTQDAGLRSGISGIGAHAAGAPPVRFARREDDPARRRVRSYRWDEEEAGTAASAGAGARTEVEIADERSPADRRPETLGGSKTGL